MRDYAELVTRLKQSDDNCNAECCECSGECLSSGCNIFSEAADAIEELLAKNTNVPNKWISVEERLPEVEQSVLFCVFGRSVGEGTYRGHDGFHHVWKMYAVAGTYWDDEVTHWMPLPKAPEPPKVVE